MKMNDFSYMKEAMKALGHGIVETYEGEDRVVTILKNPKRPNGTRIIYHIRHSIVLRPQIIRNNR